LESELGESKGDERVVCTQLGEDGLKGGLGQGAARKDQGLQVAIELNRMRLLGIGFLDYLLELSGGNVP